MYNEQDLIQACKKGIRAAQCELYDRYAPKMMSLCCRYLSNRDEAADALQEGFIRVFDHISQLRSDCKLEAWIRRIMVNTVLGIMRQKKTHFWEANDIRLPDDAYQPGVLEKLGAEELLRLIARLPAGYRTVFNLYAIEGYDHNEIASMLGISESTSRTQFLKARIQLQQKLTRLSQVKGKKIA